MPNRAIRIVILAAGLALPAGAAQQAQPETKTATQPAPPPQQPVRAKYEPVSRDVCEKHPNLKQCA